MGFALLVPESDSAVIAPPAHQPPVRQREHAADPIPMRDRVTPGDRFALLVPESDSVVIAPAHQPPVLQAGARRRPSPGARQGHPGDRFALPVPEADSTVIAPTHQPPVRQVTARRQPGPDARQGHPRRRISPCWFQNPISPSSPQPTRRPSCTRARRPMPFARQDRPQIRFALVVPESDSAVIAQLTSRSSARISTPPIGPWCATESPPGTGSPCWFQKRIAHPPQLTSRPSGSNSTAMDKALMCGRITPGDGFALLVPESESAIIARAHQQPPSGSGSTPPTLPRCATGSTTGDRSPCWFQSGWHRHCPELTSRPSGSGSTPPTLPRCRQGHPRRSVRLAGPEADSTVPGPAHQPSVRQREPADDLDARQGHPRRSGLPCWFQKRIAPPSPQLRRSRPSCSGSTPPTLSQCAAGSPRRSVRLAGSRSG